MTEDPRYLSDQLLTYLGNKRALLPEIGAALVRVKRRLGRRKLSILDGFSGSGVVSRFFKAHAHRLVANDLEDYATAVSRCYLRNRSEVDPTRLDDVVQALNAEVDRHACGSAAPVGFIEEMYAPADDTRITAGERVFYSRRNARRLDRYRQLIERLPDAERALYLGPLLAEASVHANTAGVFKGFYKDRRTGLGRFGGSNGDALSRILGEIRLDAPVLSRFGCDVEVTQGDANVVAGRLRNLDLAYFDPPYNQHPYGSNYFMLNLIVRYVRPESTSRVSGIPVDWMRSEYNVRARALGRLRQLLQTTDARYLLVSFSDDGFISRAELDGTLRGLGTVSRIARRYNTFRGSRNLKSRRIYVTEQLFLVER